MTSLRRERSDRGQATIEFMIVFPALMGLFILALALAVGWHTHHLSASLALEGASLESRLPGLGGRMVGATSRRLAPSTGMTTETEPFPYSWLAGSGVEGNRFTVLGGLHLPWAPLGLDLDTNLRGTVYAPKWEFNGAP
jgi:hypothetical protein